VVIALASTLSEPFADFACFHAHRFLLGLAKCSSYRR
jgi:hypothetical protein